VSFPRYPEYKNSGVDWLGEAPINWSIGRLKYLLRIRGGQDYKAVESADPKDYPVIGSGGHFTYATSFLYDGESVLLGRKGTIDKPLYIRGKFWTVDTMFYTEVLPKTYGRYAYYAATTIPFSLYSTNTALPSMSQFDLANHALPLPSYQEQTQIARFLDHETAKIDTLIHEQKRLIELLKEKRQAVISHAVTKGLDPDVPMKDSGVEWLGEVPAHWACMSFRYATRILRGKFGHRPRNDPALYDGAYPFIQTGDVARAEKYISEFKQTLNEKGAAVSASFPSGTLVMAIAANIGDTAILGFEAYAPDSVVGFQPRQDITLEFLKYSLDSSIQELEKTSTQSTQANLNIDRVGGVKGVFPPEDEQTKIVSFLDKMCEQFSILEKQATKSIALMVERRSALISAAVTGKIDVRDWQPPADESAFDEKVRQAGMERRFSTQLSK